MSNQLGLSGYRGIGKLGLPNYGNVWTWIDRLRADPPSNSLGPSYSESTSGQTVESFTVAMANPAGDGWGDSVNKIPTSHGDLRRGGETFKSFMTLARQLNPQFLIINQFNEFAQPDQGWNEETTNDIEPTNLWGNKYIDLVKQEIAKYRGQIVPPIPTPTPSTGGGSGSAFSFSSATAKTQLWPALNLIDSDKNSCYSSQNGDLSNSKGEFIAAWFPGEKGLMNINQLELTPRIFKTQILSFPRVFDLYVTAPDNSSWIFLKKFSQSELSLNSNGKYILNFQKTVKTWGVLIVPNQLGVDDNKNYYFQLCGMKGLFSN